MSRLLVDTEALLTLAARMAGTRDEVALAARLVGDGASGPAGGLVASALADFDEHWRYGLKQMVGNLDACAQALHDAARTYQRVEDAIAAAASA
jgi:uncharacterized protein YukE